MSLSTLPHAVADAALLHELQAQRFSWKIDEQLCELCYELTDSVVTFHHTGVPAALGGRGLAGELVAAGLAWARDEQLRVVPACSYVRTYMKRHPETQDLLAK